jgi:hypothetical protein
MKFYPSDWAADEKLRMCSLAARGLWIEMIALMHRSDQYGHLLVGNIAPTDAQLAVLVGASPDQIPDLIGELESVGVFSRTRKGVIYSRRMSRDEKRSQNARKNGAKGGNPKLGKQKENSGSDNLPDKGQHKPQKPEARSQSEKEEANASSKRAPPKTCIPDGWSPQPFGDDSEAGRIISSWDERKLRREAEAFTRHHRAKGSKMADWHQAWGTWVNNTVKFGGQRHGNGQHSGNSGAGEFQELARLAAGSHRPRQDHDLLDYGLLPDARPF